MNKAALSLALILVLFISVMFVGMADSAPTYTIPTGPLTPPVISMESPISATYVSWFVPLKFSVNGSWDGFVDHCIIEVSLDEDIHYVIYDPPFRVNKIAQNFSITMGPLSEGIHNLQVIATVGGIYRTSPNDTIVNSHDFTSKAQVYFTVNTLNQAQISILSPLNQTYNANSGIPVEFTVNKTASILKMGYTLDQQSNVTIPRNTTLYGPISDGEHTLKIYSTFSDILPVSSTIKFTVDTTAPSISILSLKNKVYNSSDIPLIFTVNETTSQITYILDGKVYTIYGNTTLTIPQDGDHKLTIYATDQTGNAGASDTVDFKVQAQLPPQIAFPILPPMAIVLIGGLGLLIYFEKRSQSKRIKIDKSLHQVSQH
jgi:hypothetical protein